MLPEARLRLVSAKGGAVALVLLAAVLAPGCAKKKSVRVPVAPVPGSTEVGIASWYGRPYHGRRAANGEIYDMEKLTAAHRTLPFDTWVEVRNLQNDRTVRVRIIDRGPFVEGRIIDLSRAAAREIAMLGPGTARVRLEVVERPSTPATDLFAVQVGAFRDRGNAERLQRSMRQRYGDCRLTLRDGEPKMFLVLVGKEPTLEGANALAGQLRAELGSAFVVRLDAPAADTL